MTVSSTTNRISFAGDSASTSFATSPVIFFATSELEVRVVNDTTEVETLLVENTDYDVTGGAGAVGTVDTSNGSSPHGVLVTGTTLVILRVMPLTQLTDLVANAISDAEVAEDDLDKLVLIAQQLSEVDGRTVKVADGSPLSGSVLELPLPVGGEVFGWNAGGTAIVSYEINATAVASAAASAVAAAASETNAGTSETNAAASYDSFDDRYLGAKASDPTLDNDSNALLTGALYFNTGSSDMRVYNGATWDSLGLTVVYNESFTATEGQTSFTISGGYVVGNMGVYLNGARLVVTSDFVATDGTTIVLQAGANVNDTVMVEHWQGFTVVNAIAVTLADNAGDMLYATAADSFGIVAIGAEDTQLTTVSGLPAWRAPTSRKNAIINGDFNVWQRGTSFAAAANAAYSADRWQYTVVGTAVHTLSRSTDVPTVAESGRLYNYSMLVDCTTADASIAAGDRVAVLQSVEGYNWLPLAQKAMTLSFWVKGTKTGIHCVGLRNSGSDRSWVSEFTINTTATWEKKTITIDASPSAGTWSYTTAVGLAVFFVLAAGSTFHTTADAWQTGDFQATSNQVNACDADTNDFRICGVQLEEGSVATPFEYRTIQEERELCHRYCYVIGEAAVHAANEEYIANGFCNTTSSARLSSAHPVVMRTAPTATVSNQALFGLRNAADTGIATTTLSANAISDKYIRWLAATAGTPYVAGDATSLYIQASQVPTIIVAAEL